MSSSAIPSAVASEAARSPPGPVFPEPTAVSRDLPLQEAPPVPPVRHDQETREQRIHRKNAEAEYQRWLIARRTRDLEASLKAHSKHWEASLKFAQDRLAEQVRIIDLIVSHSQSVPSPR